MYHLGIDISKDSFAVHLLMADSSFSGEFVNRPKGFKALLKWLRALGAFDVEKLNVVMEATGVYWEKLAYYLKGFEYIRVAVINPAQIKYFISSVLRRGKTDSMDAKMIALYSLRMETREFIPVSQALAELKLLTKERDSIVKLLGLEQRKLHAHKYRKFSSKTVLKLIKRRISLYKKQLLDLELLIKDLIRSDKDLSRVYSLLLSSPGIGFVTAIVIMSETNNLSNFDNSKQLTAFVGIAPAPNQSGDMKKQSRISKIGNARLRRAVYMAALSSCRSSKHFKNFKERLLVKNKPKKLIIVALARKLLVTAFAVVKSNKAFDPNYQLL